MADQSTPKATAEIQSLAMTLQTTPNHHVLGSDVQALLSDYGLAVGISPRGITERLTGCIAHQA